MKVSSRDDVPHPQARARTLPQRRKPSLAAQIKPFWIVALLLAGGLGWGGALLAGAPNFRVARVGIDVPIDSPVSRERVGNAAAIARGSNVWLIDTRAVERRIEAIPYVDRASIHRGQFPQPFVEVAITVRRPSACVHSGDRQVTIDAVSRVLQTGCARADVARIDAGRARIPLPGGTLADPGLTKLLADVKVLADANLGIRRVGRDRWGGLEAVDVTGVTLRFGDDGDLRQKAGLIQPVRAGIGASRPIRAIDVRAPGTPVVEFR